MRKPDLYIVGCLIIVLGVAYDPVMLKHECLCENSGMHPENPDRLNAILTRLQDKGFFSQCEVSLRRYQRLKYSSTCFKGCSDERTPSIPDT